MKGPSRRLITAVASALLLTVATPLAKHNNPPFKIQDAEYMEQTELLIVEGKGEYRCVVEIFYASSGEFIGSTIVPDKRWRFTIKDLEPVPCRVFAIQLETEDCQDGDDEMDVEDAPQDCE